VTSDGKKLHKELLKKQTDRNKKLLKDFSNEEIVHMQKLLDKLLISSQKYLILN
jgi:DNA-binding MarR family transcriptional regulator